MTKKVTTAPVPKSARTEANKERRMARHAKRYPQTSTKTAAQRRQLGRIWKAEAARRAEAGQVTS